MSLDPMNRKQKSSNLQKVAKTGSVSAASGDSSQESFKPEIKMKEDKIETNVEKPQMPLKPVKPFSGKQTIKFNAVLT